LYEDEPEMRLILTKYIALALVPRDQLKPCFKLLRKHIGDRIKPFVEYFEHQWLHKMGPDLWHVADSAIRTNNSSECK